MYSAQGIILRREDFRERDERIVLYTKEFGKLSVIAKGTKRIEAKLRGNLDLFNLVDIIFVEGAYFPILTGVELRDRFPALGKSDASIYSVALSVARIVVDIFEENQKEKDFFDFFLFVIQKLDEHAKGEQASLYSWLLLKKFEMHVLESQGHGIEWAKWGVSKNALRLLEMLRNEAHTSVRVPREDFARIEEAFGKIFAYFFNYRVPFWTPLTK